MTSDSLDISFYELIQQIGPRPCDCPLYAFHHELCWMTPIYAELATTTNSPGEVLNTMAMEMWELSCQQTGLAGR